MTGEMFEYDGPRAAELLDLFAMQSDLIESHGCFRWLESCEALDAEWPDGLPGLDRELLVGSIWTSGLIRYRRSFTSGKAATGTGQRARLHDLLDGWDYGSDAMHQELLRHASRRIAHRADHDGFGGEVNILLSGRSDSEPVVVSLSTLEELPPTGIALTPVVDHLESLLERTEASLAEKESELKIDLQSRLDWCQEQVRSQGSVKR
ncbi:hypothetical protein [Ilumatobacter coccineus]|uniref:Uncharacterized protein n=1 Tax=Ilumatobacter coccineus (strain NBRC 103263 / KCTC 29153 / YM16-304) TaxID=1313172 RepID=A0A6C7E4I3_ILUCY|nr:hypothetical protein [Ilumatobacter coccineus]BAN01530.1 hypothetical protein YM304_12160 [Ilumatobacter coccineus YM16-304]